MSREQYVDYAISKGLRISDNQIRMPPRMRMATSLESYDQARAGMTAKEVRTNPQFKAADNAFSMFAQNMKDRAGTQIEPGIRVRTGTKNSSSWLYWGINNGAPEQGTPRTDKTYLGFDNPFISLTPQRMQEFIRTLRDRGYNGDIKTVQDLVDATHISDQIVLHGRTKQDADLGLQIGKEFFKDDLTFFEQGYDSAHQSYSQILESKIENALPEVD